MLRRIAAVAALALIVATPLVHADRIKLNVWIGNGSWIPYVEDFNRVQDKYEAVYTVNGSLDALVAAVAAGDPPDVFRADSNGVLNLATKGVIRPLEPFIERDKLDLSGFIPGVLAQTQWHGHTWALPLNASSDMLYYNKDMMSAAGLDPGTPPKTWDEFEAQARKLTKIAADGSIQQLGYSWSFAQEYLLNMFQSRISLLNDDKTRTGFNTDGMKSLLSRWLANQDQINGGEAAAQQFRAANGDDTQELFINQKMAFHFGGQSGERHLPPAVPGPAWGIVAPPLPDGGVRVNIAGGHRVTIPMGAKNVEGAWDYIKWLTSEEAGLAFAEPGFSQQFVTQNYQGIGQSASARVDVDTTAPFFKNPLWAPFVQEAVYAAAYPSSPNDGLAYDAIVSLLPNVLNHKISPASGIEQAAAAADAQIAEAVARQDEVMKQFK